MPDTLTVTCPMRPAKPAQRRAAAVFSHAQQLGGISAVRPGIGQFCRRIPQGPGEMDGHVQPNAPEHSRQQASQAPRRVHFGDIAPCSLGGQGPVRVSPATIDMYSGFALGWRKLSYPDTHSIGHTFMTPDPQLPTLDAVDLRDRLATGALSAVELARACIARIEAREAEIEAWVWFDAEAVLQQAERLDSLRASGDPLGPLHGLPVGVKDVIDTAGIPTRNGCPIDAGRVPQADADVVVRLKAAGAIMFGKTVTTELAFLHPNKTRNPHNPRHTPGGSSSGSAAAVADGMIPLAIGTQTGGSVVRPASFCGITGFKPSLHAISRHGVLMQSHSLDTVGVFARDPGGAALLATALFEGRPTPAASSAERLHTALADRDRPPVLALMELPGWDRADRALREAFAAFRAQLGGCVIDADLPGVFGESAAHRAVINTAEMGHYYRRYLEAGADKLGPPTRAAIEEGLQMPAHTYLAALAHQDALGAALEPVFARCDAILCPAALGPAPEGLGSTGDSIFNGLWTMAGTPAITLPLLTAPNGLPMGVQLVGPVGGDLQLLRTARWLWDLVQANGA